MRRTRGRNLEVLPQIISTLAKAPVGSAERRDAVKGLITMAMKADTLELLDRHGKVPAALSYKRDQRNHLEGEK